MLNQHLGLFPENFETEKEGEMNSTTVKYKAFAAGKNGLLI